MKGIVRPNKVTDEKDYAKYLLMNTNNCFCQSKIAKAENLMEEIEKIDYTVHESIPGFVPKEKDLKRKIKAYYGIDKIWNRFLKTKEATVDELEEVYPPSSICEKQTLVKYSYMTAHYYLCNDEVDKAMRTFQSRTLKIAEKTTLRVKDVKGMAPEVKKMKKFFQLLPELEDAWQSYIETGVSPGFKESLPVFPCYPLPNMKEYVLKGLADVCNSGDKMLKKIKKLEVESGVAPDYELEEEIKKLKALTKENNKGINALNKAWKAFLPENKVVHTDYGYEFCNKEPLIRAYIMDGFASVCDLADEALVNIDSIRRTGRVKLDEITIVKIDELKALKEHYQTNGSDIERIWKGFVAHGDMLTEDYQSRELYCDHISEVKDWTMRGLSASCEEARPYLEKIEEFNETFEFRFYEELECRVQRLRIKVWECTHNALVDLAKIQTPDGGYEERLQELMEEYGVGEQPEPCPSDQ